MATTEPRPLRWTADDYYRLCEEQWFQQRRVQLIDGEIIEMPAQKNAHGVGVGLTELALQQAFGTNHWVRVQMSLDLSPHSVPDPDLAVVPGTPRTHAAATGNPTTALLVVEVSESILSYDRNAKSSLYAAAGILDYWIVNLIDRQLEVYRGPGADSTRLHGFGYATRTILDRVDTVTPLAAPGASIPVVDLLP